MERTPIALKDLVLKPYFTWDSIWFLLTAGDFSTGHFNTMTVSWGSLGCIWNKPFAQVFVRPQRYTFEFMEKYPTFSLCAFTKEYRKDLNILGAKSGRNGDKIALTKLTPCAAQSIAAPIFEQASLVLECRKMFRSEFLPEQIIDKSVLKNYPDNDFHRIYFGEIVAASGTAEFAVHH
jgi:flavin reductase (DIM6/NTAB) family NADH-FMN oxidoreductase RutF